MHLYLLMNTPRAYSKVHSDRMQLIGHYLELVNIIGLVSLPHGTTTVLFYHLQMATLNLGNGSNKIRWKYLIKLAGSFYKEAKEEETEISKSFLDLYHKLYL